MKFQEKVKYGFYSALAGFVGAFADGLHWTTKKMQSAEILLISAAARLK